MTKANAPIVPAPIVLACDFGLPYTGQMTARLCADAPGHPVIDLFHDLPAHDVLAASILLAAHAADFPEGSVFVCVVDPGVGTNTREPGAVFAGGRWFVGPLNGVFEHVLRRWPEGARAYRIAWRPAHLSNSFHGRDLFAPQAAKIAQGDLTRLEAVPLDAVRHAEFPDDLEAVIYIDGFGNAMTGVRAETLGPDDGIEVAGRSIARARTFGQAESGGLLCYENAVGLMEIAANRGSVARILALGPQTPIKIIKM